jgi:transcriptional regulator with XRE-family HTH domain
LRPGHSRICPRTGLWISDERRLLQRWRARERKDLTQERLAEKAGLDPTYISSIERGLRNPGIKNVARLAKALGLSTAELCKGVDA